MAPCAVASKMANSDSRCMMKAIAGYDIEQQAGCDSLNTLFSTTASAIYDGGFFVLLDPTRDYMKNVLECGQLAAGEMMWMRRN